MHFMKPRKYLVLTVLTLALLGAAAWAQTSAAPAPKRKHKPAATAPAPPAITAADVQSLKDALAAQQQQIQQLNQQLQQAQQNWQQAQSTAADAANKAAAAQAQASQEDQTVGALKGDVADLKLNSTNAALSLQETQKSIKTALDNPVVLHYKGVNLTPGGFVAAYGIYRSHNTSSDGTSTFGGIPFSGTSNAHLSEFRLTERHSNLSLMADSNVRGIQTKAYVEIDFEGAAPTANENISNSFTPRVREFWVNAETKNGLAFMGGQGWELLTPNRKSIAPKTEFRPATIDASYLVGYHYARETMFRITDRISNKVTFAAAVENPETVIQGSGAPGNCASAVPCIVPGGQGTGFAAVTSTDVAPDIAAKVAFDPGWGHYELGGIARFYRSRFVTTLNSSNGGTNNTNISGAFAVNAIVPLVPKKIDFFLDVLAGRGLGRFLPGGGVDVIVNPSGNLIPVKAAGVMGGFEIHPTPNWDIDLYGGNEYYARTIYLNSTGGQVGYGRTTGNQTYCSVEVTSSSSAACETNNRDIWEITPQIWRRFWKGKEGTLQWGLEYEYIHRKAWAGTNVAIPPALTPSPFQPSGIQNVMMTAVRWYFP